MEILKALLVSYSGAGQLLLSGYFAKSEISVAKYLWEEIVTKLTSFDQDAKYVRAQHLTEAEI